MNKQKGFGLVGILTVVLAISTISGAGYYVWNKQNKDAVNDTQSAQKKVNHIKSYDSSKSFSYSYPELWDVQPFVWENCCDIEQIEPDWTQEIQPITLHPSDDKQALITIVSEPYGNYYESYFDLKEKVKEDYFANILFEGARDDGHEALFTRVDYLGPPDAKVESFTDHRYYFDNGTNYVRIEFREKYHHDWPDDETGPDVNNSKYLEDFKSIAESIVFKN